MSRKPLQPNERFPWHRHNPGEAFFVPALHPDEVMREGLLAGRQMHGPNVYLKARFVICKGLLGVLFWR